MVELPGEVLGVVEHLVSDVRLHLDGGAEDAHAPQKAPDHDGQDDPHHGHTDPVQQEVHVKDDFHAVHQHVALVDAVDHHLIEIWNDQLHIVHEPQEKQAADEPYGIFCVVFVDMLSKDHTSAPPLLLTAVLPQARKPSFPPPVPPLPK